MQCLWYIYWHKCLRLSAVLYIYLKCTFQLQIEYSGGKGPSVVKSLLVLVITRGPSAPRGPSAALQYPAAEGPGGWCQFARNLIIADDISVGTRITKLFYTTWAPYPTLLLQQMHAI